MQSAATAVRDHPDTVLAVLVGFWLLYAAAAFGYELRNRRELTLPAASWLLLLGAVIHQAALPPEGSGIVIAVFPFGTDGAGAAAQDQLGSLPFVGATLKRAAVEGARGNWVGQQVENLVEPGDIDPAHVHLPGVFVARVVHTGPQEKRIEKRTVSGGTK